MVFKTVLLRTDGIKYVIIPKKCDIKAGDDVQITKVEGEKCQKKKK